MDPNRQFHDIKPKTPQPFAETPAVVTTPPVTETPAPATQEAVQGLELPSLESKDNLVVPKKKRSLLKWTIITLVIVVILVAGALAAGYAWYTTQLTPLDSNNTQKQLLTVKEGSTLNQVAAQLKQQNLIRSEQAFGFYGRSNNIAVHAGVYLISPDASVQQIAKKLSSGKVDSFNLTLLPGANLMEDQKALKKAGFKEADIKQALTATYKGSALAGKPKNTSLEGFIYGDTYNFMLDATPQDVIQRTIDQMSAYIEKEQLEAAFKAQGLTLYQGITLASIIQKEVAHPEDMAHVSQVFHSRLHTDMPLGSDVTFIYGAKLLGVAPTPELDSPYNTRVHKGLPPTPIANPGADALYAAAHPSKTDDLFFVAGDDGTTYFSKSNEEHEALTQKYCHVNCELPQD